LERIGIVVFEDVMLWAAATSARRASRFTTTSMRTVGDFAFVAGAAGTRMGPVGGACVGWGVTAAVDMRAFQVGDSGAGVVAVWTS
jgi:hypothetical protein